MHRHSKVVRMRHKKQMASLTSAEKGNLITVVACMNATGIYIPPLIMFPSKIGKRSFWMEHQQAQFQLAIQVVGFRQMRLLNGSIILFTSLSLHAPAT